MIKQAISAFTNIIYHSQKALLHLFIVKETFQSFSVRYLRVLAIFPYNVFDIALYKYASTYFPFESLRI